MFCPDNESYIKKYNYQKKFSDSLSIKKELTNLIFSFNQNGYLSASIDSIKYDSTLVSAYVFLGNKYNWGNISFNNIDESTLRKLNIKTKNLNLKSINLSKLNNLQKNIISYYENNGYPFASLEPDEIKISNDTININYNLIKNSLIVIDSITIKGNAKISKKYIKNYLGINNGDLYNENKLKSIESVLKEIIFLEEEKPYQILLKKDKANLLLYLKNKKANQFNGILGILPNNKTTGKTMLTGDLYLLLLNSFGKGEMLSINWQKLEVNSQNLKIRATYPYLFSTQFGIDANFMLFKKDTSYLNINTNLGIQYLLQGNNYVKAYYENKKSSLISTSGLENITVLPSYCDFQTNLFGFSYNIEKLDYKYNPYKGYAFNINFGAGNKKIEKNSKINPVVYNKINLNSTQYEGQGIIIYFQPITEKTTLKLQNKSGLMENSNLFENELYKIGGYKTLRGFDEESIYASIYSILTIEYRLIFEKNSCFYIFGDGAYYEKNTQNFIHDTPYGFGVGVDFETKAGIFSISYAVGKQFDNPIEIRSAKIHLGFINRF